MKKIITALGVTMALTSCTDATQAKIGGYGGKFKIEMVNCDGTIAREYMSSGKVQSEENSDGYFFMDANTGKLIEITGRIIITKQ